MTTVKVYWMLDTGNLFADLAGGSGSLRDDHAACSRGLPVVVADDGRVLGTAEVPKLECVRELIEVDDDRGIERRAPWTAAQVDLIARAKLAGYRIA